MLGLYYLAYLHLGSVLQAGGVEGLFPNIITKIYPNITKYLGSGFVCHSLNFLFLFFARLCHFLSLGCYLSFSYPEKKKQEMLLLMMQFVRFFGRIWPSSPGSPAHSPGARAPSARALCGSCLHSQVTRGLSCGEVVTKSLGNWRLSLLHWPQAWWFSHL